MPLQINSENGEPYLQLPAPHSNIRITPPRMSDVPTLTAILNDPEVYPYLATPPYPYLEEHAVAFLELAKAHSDEGFAEIKGKILAGEEDYVASRCPVLTIREVQPDGTDIYIGNISFVRYAFYEIQDQEERARRCAENNEKEKGDPSIIWTFGSE
jgi:RimJ/RimL family protein N-acetyltransferase